MLTYHHTTPSKKKKGVVCRFNAPWTPLNKTRIVHSEEKIAETIVMQSKKFIDEVRSYIVTISDLSDVRLSEILEECGATIEQYDNPLGPVEKTISKLYNNKPCEVNIG